MGKGTVHLSHRGSGHLSELQSGSSKNHHSWLCTHTFFFSLCFLWNKHNKSHNSEIRPWIKHVSFWQRWDSPSRMGGRENNINKSQHLITLSCCPHRAFSFAGPFLWSSLPLVIRKAQDYGNFSGQCRRFYSNAWMTECWTLFMNISLAFISMNLQMKLKSDFTFITFICLCVLCAGCLNSGLWLLVSQIK